MLWLKYRNVKKLCLRILISKTSFFAAFFALALAIYMIVSAFSFDFDNFGVAYMNYAIGRYDNL